MPGAGCTRGHRAVKVAQKRALTKQVQPRHPGIPCAVVYGLLRALPGEPACLSPSPCGASAPQDLAPAWARQNHTTSPSAKIAVRLTTSSRPPHPAPNVRDDAYAPHRGGTAGIITDFGKKEREIFLRRHLERRDALDSARNISIHAHENSGPRSRATRRFTSPIEHRSSRNRCSRPRRGFPFHVTPNPFSAAAVGRFGAELASAACRSLLYFQEPRQ